MKMVDFKVRGERAKTVRIRFPGTVEVIEFPVGETVKVDAKTAQGKRIVKFLRKMPEDLEEV
jgi:hypothetical protein